MNDIFWRVMWKEYRAQRGLWLTVAGVALTLQLGWLLFFPADPILLFGIGVVLPAFYTLGCAAVLFASEREERTSEFLRSLPCSSAPLFAGKVAFGVVSTIAMPIVLVASAWVLSAHRLTPPSVDAFVVLSVYWAVCTSAFFACGLFFSLLSNRVLIAACLAAPATVLLLLASYWLFSDSEAPGLVWLLPVLIVAAVDTCLARWWIGESQVWRPNFAMPKRSSARLATLVGTWDFQSRGARQMRRLIWQEWRQARTVFWIYLGVGIVFCMIPGQSVEIADRAGLFILMAAPILFGACVFRGEQHRRHYRYLADRGLSPAAVWFSKQIVWVTLTVVGLSLLLIVETTLGGNAIGGIIDDARRNSPGYEHLVIPTLLLLACSMYGAAQMMSLLVRSTITATFVAIACLIPIIAWHQLIVVTRPSLIFAAALPLTLGLTTYVRIDDWMREQHTRGAWMRFGLALGAPMGIALALLAAYRVYEVPADGPGFSVEEYLGSITAEQRETGEMYLRAGQQVQLSRIGLYFVTEASYIGRRSKSRSVLHRWIGRNRAALELTREAANRPDCFISQRSVAQHGIGSASARLLHCHSLLLVSARLMETSGELDAAFDRYLAALRMARHMQCDWSDAPARINLEIRTLSWLQNWAGHSQQTAARLSGAADQLRQEFARLPSPTDRIKAHHIFLSRALLDDAPPFEGNGGLWRLWRRMIGSRSIWERSRDARILDAVTSAKLAYAQAAQDTLEGDTVSMVAWQKEMAASEGRKAASAPWQWYRTSLSLPEVVDIDLARRISEPLVNLETFRRATLLLFHLQAWNMEHGEFPDRLEQLEVANLEQLNVDPWSGRAFGYRAEGFQPGLAYRIAPTPSHGKVSSVWERWSEKQGYRTGHYLGENRPVLWSAGRNNGTVIPDEKLEGRQRFVAVSLSPDDSDVAQEPVDDRAYAVMVFFSPRS